MSWLYRLLHRGQMEQQLDKELAFYLDQCARDLVARGHTPEEARRLARLSIGGPEQVKEDCRDARGTRWLEDLWQDFRYALRTLRQKPGFAAVSLLTLALGTGATTVMFTVINSVLLKPLPYARPERLIQLQEQTDWSTQFGNTWAFSYPNYLDCQRGVRSVDMAIWRDNSGTISKPGDPEYVEAREISAGLFPLLGVAPFRGRNFLPQEDRQGGSPVAIIGYGIWQRRFGASAAAIGAPIVFDGRTYTIVGVMPPDFRLMLADVDVFVPVGQETGSFLNRRDAHFGFNVVARLKPGAKLENARAELQVIGSQLRTQYPATNRGRTFIADTLRPDVASDIRSTLWMLLGAVTLVLLIACANIGSLLLARAVSRERELAMRVALGAGRGRLTRQCLTESAVLALGGGALGVLLASLGVRPFITFWPGGLPLAQDARIDWRVLVFALAIALASSFVFGLAPALRAPARDLEQVLRAGARAATGGARRLHSGFVMAEIALAVVLLVAAGMLGRTLLHLSSLSPGLDIHNVLVARMALPPATLSNPARTRAAWQDVLDRARQTPGVQAIAMVDTIPMRLGSNTVGYGTTPNLPPPDQRRLLLANSVTPDYLNVTHIPLRSGRFLEDRDGPGNEKVAVIDEVLARQAFPGEDAVGKYLWVGIDTVPTQFRVIGVVGHVRQWGLAGDDGARVRAEMYYSFAQIPDTWVRRWSELMSIAVKTSVDPLSIVTPLQHAVAGATNDQVLYQVFTLELYAKASLARQRFLMLLFGVFAGLALLLASIGIYGVLAYLTGQRVPEIGVRMALGATAQDVLRLVLRQSLMMVFGGIVAGALVAAVASRVLQRVVEGMQPNELSAFAITLPVLIAAALVASLAPALRASRIDPTRALRQE